MIVVSATVVAMVALHVASSDVLTVAGLGYLEEGQLRFVTVAIVTSAVVVATHVWGQSAKVAKHVVLKKCAIVIVASSAVIVAMVAADARGRSVKAVKTWS